MPKTKEISLQLRKKIVEAHDKGEGYTAISKHFTVSRTAVRCIIAKYKETNSVRNKPGRGRKCKISRTLERKIVRDVSKMPRTSAKMIVADLASSGVDVSRNTVVRALHRGGLQGHRPRRTPLLKQRHITARLRFAREHLKGKDEFLGVCALVMRLNWNCLGTWMLLMFGEERVRPSTLRTQFPQLNMVVGASCCGAVLQPQAQGALFGCMAS